MKAVIQRCHAAHVAVNHEITGKITHGLAIFLGIAESDDEQIAARLAAKISKLRIFSNDDGRFDLSVRDVDGSALVIPNFTLYGDASKGNRPHFMSAATPEKADALYRHFVLSLQHQNVPTQCGVFGADMTVNVSNSGPVTLILEM